MKEVAIFFLSVFRWMLIEKMMRQVMIAVFALIMFLMIIGMTNGPKTQDCDCDCPDYIHKAVIEHQYEQLIRPITVEAVGFQGMVLKDSIGTVFVITDDKALHEVLEYSYNVGDTIR